MGKHWINKVKSYPEAYVMFNHVTMYEDAQRLEILLKPKTSHP